MKYRDSGVPSEDMWDSFFTPDEILSKMVEWVDKQ